MMIFDYDVTTVFFYLEDDANILRAYFRNAL